MGDIRRSKVWSTVCVIAVASSLGVAQVPAPRPADPTPSPKVAVTILPFRALRVDAATAWIGEGIQQSIVAELSRATNLTLVEMEKVPLDQDALLADARAKGIHALVVGSYQTSGDELRATGKVLLSNGKTAAFLSAKAPLKEVFRVQDELAKQVRQALVPPEPATRPSTPPDTVQPESPGLGYPALPGATPRPFKGSALERALKDEDAGRKPWDGTTPPSGRANNHSAPPTGENPNGWGSVPGGYGNDGGWVPTYPVYPVRPPVSPGPNSGGDGSGGGSNPPSTPGGGSGNGGGSSGGGGGGNGSGGSEGGGGTPPTNPNSPTGPFIGKPLNPNTPNPNSPNRPPP